MRIKDKLNKWIIGIGLVVVCTFLIAASILGSLQNITNTIIKNIIDESPQKIEGELVPKLQHLTVFSDGSSPSSTMPSVTFELVNQGSCTVTIDSIESSCGCTSVTASSLRVSPGETTFIKAEVTPIIYGEQSVTVDLKTDSVVNPDVNLYLTVFGSREPPILVDAIGDLTYMNGNFDQARNIYAITLEKKGHKTGRRPDLTTDLKYVTFNYLEHREQVAKDLTKITHTYKITIDSSIAPQEFSGSLEIIDPWNSDHRRTIPIYGKRVEAISVSPSRLALRSHNGRYEGRLVVKTARPISELTFISDNQQALFSVEKLWNSDDGLLRGYLVSLDEVDAVEEDYQLILKWGENDSDTIVLPVMLRGEHQ